MAWYENVPAPGSTWRGQGRKSLGCINGDKKGLKNGSVYEWNLDRMNQELEKRDFEFQPFPLFHDD